MAKKFVNPLKKIAYIELDTHAEIASQFMELMQESKVFSVHYYFSSKIANRLSLKETSNISIVNPQTILQEIEMENHDLLIIGSVHRYFKTFNKLVSNYRSAVIVHNGNFAKASVFKLLKGIVQSDFWYRLKLLFKESLLSSPKVYQKATQQLILDSALEIRGAQELPLFFNKSTFSAHENSVTVVIPGEVSQNRRNYQHAIKVIQNLLPEKPIQFIFLGRAQGKEFQRLESLSKNLPAKVKIVYFNERVPQDIFDEWMVKADVLWCPIKREISFFGIKEIYGKTKMTGNFGDSIKYGKLAIFPENYQAKHRFIVTESENFLSQIDELRKQKFDFTTDFSQEKIRGKLEETLLRLAE